MRFPVVIGDAPGAATAAAPVGSGGGWGDRGGRPCRGFAWMWDYVVSISLRWRGRKGGGRGPGWGGGGRPRPREVLFLKVSCDIGWSR